MYGHGLMRSGFVSVLGLTLASYAALAQPQNASNYLVLDGLDDVVTVDDAFFLTDTLTIETWINITSVHPNFAAGLVTYGSPNKSSFDFAIGPADNPVPVFFINWNQGQHTIVGNTPIPFNEWHHLAVTYDGNTASLYIDGVLDKQQVFGASILPSDTGALLAIGDDYPGASEFVGGSFDEVRIWNVTRTEAEIQATMDTPLTGAEPGLIGYYDFDEGGSQTVVDKSPHNAHGQLGFTLSPGPDDPVRTPYVPSRMRQFTLTSSDDGLVQPITGSIDDQIAVIAAGPPSIGWEALVNRHADMHIRDAFVCTGDDLAKSYVDTSTYLDTIDEVTYDNCASAFYRFDFDLPALVPFASVYGTANADDLGTAFLNNAPISPVLTINDVNTVGLDHLIGNHPVLGWPTADQLFDLDVSDTVQAGHNEIAFGVCSDASMLEPAGLEFQIVVDYECVADWNVDGTENTIDFTAYLNDWNANLPEADLNGDGTINTLDVLFWLNLWTAGCPSSNNG